MEKRVLTMVEACEYLGGISRQTMCKLIGDGEISSMHIGVRQYFPRESLEAFVDARIGLWPEVDDMIENDLAGGSNEYLNV